MASWTGEQESVALLDPVAGTFTFAGVLGDLYMWSSQFEYDDAMRTAYAFGQNRASQENVYTLSLGSQTATSAEVGGVQDGGLTNLVLGGVAADGKLVIAYWGGVEKLGFLDPATGLSTFSGVMDGLFMWSDQLVYGRTTGMTVGYGQDHSGANHFYVNALGN
ncbi:MAG TPA: hypothetical protein VH062_34775 [Polyangiaceae bacterium]|nr:hypothetical protein [Polyangiaceae bacterium]